MLIGLLSQFGGFLLFKMYEQIITFKALHKAHMHARRAKRHKKEVILFEMNLGPNLTALANKLKTETYAISGYYKFMVYDPKLREIQALNYVDRIVQKALCDEFLSIYLEPRLIYDNAACRKNKGSDFARMRLKMFLHDYYKKHGAQGYVLKCDIKKYFDCIDHEILKKKLNNIEDIRIKNLLYTIIDSYAKRVNKGLPIGNQTSQWFGLYYLDEVDRLIKEQLRIKYYSRYMDDMILIHNDRQYLKRCLVQIKHLIEEHLNLSLNNKTKITRLDEGIEYLGFRFTLLKSGKVIVRLRQSSKQRIKKRYKEALANKYISNIKKNQITSSYKDYICRCRPQRRVV